MDFYSPRKLLFKAWNSETKLLMRLDSIQCVKGELSKKDHILLQFTGLYDKHQEELYEMDVVLWDSEKYIIQWNGEQCGWYITRLDNPETTQPLRLENARRTIRLCSYFQSVN
jgi:hypothetical protein